MLKTALASKDWRMINVISMGKKMWQNWGPTDVDVCIREMIRNSRKSRIGVYQNKRFLLERSWVADSLPMVPHYSGYRGQRLTVTNCRTLQGWVDGHGVARERSSLDYDLWLYGTSVQRSAVLKRTKDTLKILRNGENPKKGSKDYQNTEKFPVRGTTK